MINNADEYPRFKLLNVFLRRMPLAGQAILEVLRMLIDKMVYDRLFDDESKYWYNAWIEFAVYRNRFDFYKKIYATNPCFSGGDIDTLSRGYYENRSLILYGTGKIGRHDHYILMHSKLADRLVAFADTSETLNSLFGLPVLSPVELCNNYRDYVVVVASIDYGAEIYRQLARMGFPQQNIYYPPYQRMMAGMGNQYFDVFESSGYEVFVDAGCYDAQTALAFIRWCKGNYDMIYAFEASPMRSKICRDVFSGNNVQYELIEKACWSGKGVLHFSGDRLQTMFGGAGVQEKARVDSIDVPADSIDSVLDGQRASFIKMDLEGAELEALKGARATILKWRPKLAISMYHKPEDIVELPRYILQLVPDYRLRIRHYTSDVQETVLYAD